MFSFTALAHSYAHRQQYKRAIELKDVIYKLSTRYENTTGRARAWLALARGVEFLAEPFSNVIVLHDLGRTATMQLGDVVYTAHANIAITNDLFLMVRARKHNNLCR